MVAAFKERHDYVVGALNAIEGISCSPADGAFYAFANVEGAIRKLGLKNDLEFSEHLLLTVGVAVVPGSAFGLDGHMRISYATAHSVLEDAIGRIKKAIEG
jgi:aspartate aminotransferase